MKTKLFSLGLCVSLFHVFAGTVVAEDFVAHEWGTFTSVQGADGIQVEWNPLVTTELPGFVYNRSKPSGNPRRSITYGSKSAFRTLQRMETPVIYFYSGEERTVDVTVKFPQGLITEWFPQPLDIGPSYVAPRPVLAKLDQLVDKAGVQPGFNFSSLDTRKGISQSLIHWADVKILPAKEEHAGARLLPSDPSGSHYYAARTADANLLRVDGSVNGTNTVEYEKFLFYRGIGNFQSPLQSTLGSGEDEIRLRNTGSEELVHLFVLNVHHGQGRFTVVERLGPGEETTVKIAPDQKQLPVRELSRDISARMETALVREKLYPQEAKAMVQTWNDSWFGEEGLRVLYVLPRKWTDQILPLTLNPPPRELVRVMVGRAEMITPTMEWQLLQQVVKFSQSDEAARPRVVAETRSLGLGRFAEPTIRRILGNSPSREFSQRAWELLQATQTPTSGGNGLAQR